VSGAAGLKPALAAVDRGAALALANKECLVCAGDFFMQRAAKAGACILPADSEHNALFQALGSGNREELVRVIITASGGPFRTWAPADIEQATLAQALKHPNWSMGQKITIDSASMMNKGLEVIEASYLFALTPDEIDVLVHPQSIIHGMVEFSDRSVAAFIAGQIRFGAIARLVEATLNEWTRTGNRAPLTSADDAISIDHIARNKAASLLPQIALKAS